ncbi:MAG: rod shape-determining protein RodA [Bacteroidaceae bacterium]|nr:rod shape-determining protein RodA [Bacteroidaceae bacterium]
MVNRNDRLQRNAVLSADWVVVVVYLLLMVFGWFSICGASHEIGDTDFFDFATRSGKQIVWMGLALVIGLIILLIDDQYFDQLTGLLYVLTMVLLLVTPFIAKDIKGSRSWISLGPVNLQPAEFAKCVTALAVAKMCGQYGFSLDKMRNLLKAAFIVLLPMALIIMQKETGSALVYAAFFLVFYREGMPGAFLFTAFAAVLYFVVGIRYAEVPLEGTLSTVGAFSVMTVIWLFCIGMIHIFCKQTIHAWRIFWAGIAIVGSALFFSLAVVPIDVSLAFVVVLVGTFLYLCYHALSERIIAYFYIALFTLGSLGFLYSANFALDHLQPHQKIRIQVLLGVVTDNAGAGYNVNQSMIAIGSGGFEGKGFMNGTQTKLKYVPEQDTDFIFCTVGEEQGFIGSSAVLLLFLTLILRLVYLAERQTHTYARVYGYCVLSILLFHVFINIGMVLGLTPVIGIPLPFFSYGGSSLWGFTILLFIFLRIDAGRKM